MSSIIISNKLGRPLVDPSDPSLNDGFDNSNNELIVHMNEHFEDEDGRIFLVKRKVGNGEFGHVYKVVLDATGNPSFAMKVSRSDENSRTSLQYEANVLEYVCINFIMFQKALFQIW